MKKTVFLLALALVLAQCKETPKAEPAPEAETAIGREDAGKMAMETQVALGSTLQQKIAASGPEGAIDFCKVRALPITDSVAQKHGVAIRRVTDRARNPENKASEAEIALMAQLRQEGADMETLLEIAEGSQTHYYFPIQTADLCMKCHGTPGAEIPEGVLRILADRYPADEAIGYQPGQLRGLWKVSVPSDQ